MIATEIQKYIISVNNQPAFIKNLHFDLESSLNLHRRPLLNI